MEYRSPLGYNFKLEQSLSATNEEKPRDSPRRNDSTSLDDSGRGYFDSNSRRSSSGRSSGWQRHSNNWKSPNPRNSNQNEPVPVEQYFHPSMLENPWEEFEKKEST